MRGETLEYSNVWENPLAKKKVDMTIFKMQAEISKTMAHALRLAILYRLKEGEKTVNELAEFLDVSQSNVSQHLALMRQREIVETRKDGSNIYYRVVSPKIGQACDMVREVLLEQLNKRKEIAKAYFT